MNYKIWDIIKNSLIPHGSRQTTEKTTHYVRIKKIVPISTKNSYYQND